MRLADLFVEILNKILLFQQKIRNYGTAKITIQGILCAYQ